MASSAFSNLFNTALQEQQQSSPEEIERLRQEQLALAPPPTAFSISPSLTGNVGASTAGQAGTQSLATITEGQDIGGVEPGQGSSFFGIKPRDVVTGGIAALSAAAAPATFGVSPIIGGALLEGQNQQAANTVGGSARDDVFTVKDPEGNILPPDSVIPDAVTNPDGSTSPGIVNPDGTVSPGVVNPDGTVSPGDGTVNPNGEVVRNGGGGGGGGAALDQVGQEALQQQRGLLGLGTPEENEAAFGQFTESPGQRFLRDQQERALLRNQSAIGGLGGGNIRTALQEQAFGRSQTNLQNQLGQLGALSGRGVQQQQLGLQQQGLEQEQSQFDAKQQQLKQQQDAATVTNLINQGVGLYTQSQQPTATGSTGFLTQPIAPEPTTGRISGPV